LADVLFVLICIANQTGVNLTEALQKNLEKKTNRDGDRHLNNENYPDLENLKFDYAFARGTLLAIFIAISLFIVWLFITIYFLKNIQTLFIGFVIVVFLITFLFFDGYFESGREFDFSKKQFRKYFGSGKCRIGKWKSLETPDYFLIKRNTANMNWWRTHSGYSRRGPQFFFDREVYFYLPIDLNNKRRDPITLFMLPLSLMKISKQPRFLAGLFKNSNLRANCRWR
jgi:hypothetical protein